MQRLDFSNGTFTRQKAPGMFRLPFSRTATIAAHGIRRFGGQRVRGPSRGVGITALVGGGAAWYWFTRRASPEDTQNLHPYVAAVRVFVAAASGDLGTYGLLAKTLRGLCDTPAHRALVLDRGGIDLILKLLDESTRAPALAPDVVACVEVRFARLFHSCACCS